MDEGDPLEVMTHYSGYYLTPNAAYDRLVGTTPSKCSRRDLVADLYEPLHRRGIKLMVYLPSEIGRAHV